MSFLHKTILCQILAKLDQSILTFRGWPIGCQCWQDSTRIWQKMTNYRKTRAKILLMNILKDNMHNWTFLYNHSTNISYQTNCVQPLCGLCMNILGEQNFLIFHVALTWKYRITLLGKLFVFRDVLSMLINTF